MTDRERFIEIYNTYIKREGAKELLEYLTGPQSDFFTAPASTRYHNSCRGGLVNHSLNVYDCLCDIVSREKMKEYGCAPSEETIAIVSLLHDICKVNFYKESSRNVKDENGVWQKVPYFEIDDKLPYGHGEKSVYIITGFMRLTREEAFAIRYHMGYSNDAVARDVSAAFAMFPLCYAVSCADMEATFYIEQ
ncbi:MAG: HD domain-containing protein [Ruminococcaceae bacterium]|nr:HD domain-containing protein [Oscillospiraceae bacterium]